MTFREYIALVKHMRRRQRIFFKARKPHDMAIAKAAEREVDRATSIAETELSTGPSLPWDDRSDDPSGLFGDSRT